MKTRLQRLFFPLLPYVRRELLTAARGGGGYSQTLPKRVFAAQRGRDF